MLRDNHQRLISYLRVSVTDRCNFRCTYCMPAEGAAVVPRAELLTFEELTRVVRVGARLGLTKVRLTGGEPTVRHDLPRLVGMIAAVHGINEIAMTTNASRLAASALEFKSAGLSRINISLDTVRPERAREIARRDVFDSVMRGIEAAVGAGFAGLKFNALVLRGVNDDELCDLVRFAAPRGAQMRFIEYMPMGLARLGERNKTVAAAEILARLRDDFDLVPESIRERGNDPAKSYVCRRSGARVGLITSMSDHFCGSCNRMRLTAEGGLRPCLHQNAEVDVRGIVRANGSDEMLVAAFERAAALKWAGHEMSNFVPLYSRKEMVAIGG